MASIDHQTIIRLNRDTLYSVGVFDLAAGPVTVTLPDADKRFMSLQIINEDHYVRKRPADCAFQVPLAHEIVCPLIGKLRGTHDERYGAFRS